MEPGLEGSGFDLDLGGLLQYSLASRNLAVGTAHGLRLRAGCSSLALLDRNFAWETEATSAVRRRTVVGASAEYTHRDRLPPPRVVTIAAGLENQFETHLEPPTRRLSVELTFFSSIAYRSGWVRRKGDGTWLRSQGFGFGYVPRPSDHRYRGGVRLDWATGAWDGSIESKSVTLSVYLVPPGRGTGVVSGAS